MNILHQHRQCRSCQLRNISCQSCRLLASGINASLIWSDWHTCLYIRLEKNLHGTVAHRDFDLFVCQENVERTFSSHLDTFFDKIFSFYCCSNKMSLYSGLTFKCLAPNLVFPKMREWSENIIIIVGITKCLRADQQKRGFTRGKPTILNSSNLEKYILVSSAWQVQLINFLLYSSLSRNI